MSADAMVRNSFRKSNRNMRMQSETLQKLIGGAEFKKELAAAEQDNIITTDEAYAIADAVNRDRKAAGQPLLTEKEYKNIAAVFRTSQFYIQVTQAREDGYITEEESIRIAEAHNNDMIFAGQDAMSQEELKEIASHWKD